MFKPAASCRPVAAISWLPRVEFLVASGVLFAVVIRLMLTKHRTRSGLSSLRYCTGPPRCCSPEAAIDPNCKDILPTWLVRAATDALSFQLLSPVAVDV